MNLNYPQNYYGRYILNTSQIEEIAKMFLQKYMPSALSKIEPVDISSFAEDGLSLTIVNGCIKEHSSILGAMVFADIKRPDNVVIPTGTILTNPNLQSFSNRLRLIFTIAHETAHWILHRSYFSPGNQSYSYRKQGQLYVACRTIGIEMKRSLLKTNGDFIEWQANALAAALLMPIATFRYTANHLSDKNGIITVNAIEEIADIFQVSKITAKIRLKQLGFNM